MHPYTEACKTILLSNKQICDVRVAVVVTKLDNILLVYFNCNASSLHHQLWFKSYSLRMNIKGGETTAKECVEFRMIRDVVKQSPNRLKSQNWNGIYYIAVTSGMQLV